MSDDDARAELREIEAAATGGLSADDARRALAALRRGGLRVVRLWTDAGGEQIELGTLLGPPLSAAEFARLDRAWDATREPVVNETVRLRRVEEARLDTLYELELASPATRSEAGLTWRRAQVESDKALRAAFNRLWDEHAREHGRTFAEHLERFHGFLRLSPDDVVALPWLP